MKILVICQHYWPEPYPLQDICEELVRRGHTVQVVTDIPNYPMGKIYPEYTNGRNREQIHNGVQIKRTFTIGRRKNILFRFLNYYSYAFSSSRYVGKMKEEFDVVFANQTSPVMMSSAAMKYAQKRNKKVVLYCMDLWPASLSAGGVSRDSLLYRFFGRVSKRIYRQADHILISSEMFRSYLETEFGISREIISYHPQYASIDDIPTVENKNKETVDLMFAGNIGSAQSIPTILHAAKLLQDQPQLRWHILGEGSELEHCKKLAAQLELEDIVQFHGRKSLEEMPQYLADADAMLATLIADECISLTLPGKIQTYMASGKPIIAAANGEIPHTIRESRCGFCAPAEDAEGLAQAVREFLRCEDKEQLGKNARAYYEAHFTRERFMDALEQALLAHAQSPSQNALGVK